MAKLPKPGQPGRGSRSGAPIMALFDLLGRRWAMGVLWTLSEGGAMTFRELQERCETISPSVLNQRLSELKEAGFVTRSERGYIPTALGERIYRHRSEEHTSELQSLMRISYAVFCLKKKK